MRYAKYLVAFAMLLIIPSVALAQESRIEVAPYIGWRHGNDINDVSGVAVDLESGTAYGFTVDVRIHGNLFAEFIYSYRNTNGTLFIPPGLPEDGPVGTFDIEGNIDYYHGGLMYQFDVASAPNFKPYIVGDARRSQHPLRPG